MNFKDLTIKRAKQGLEDGKFSSSELVNLALDEIKKKDKEINSFISLNERAIEEAKEADKNIYKEEELGRLAGIPIAVKDNILVEGLQCTVGSKMLDDYIAPYNATVIEKLKKEGAIIIGKTNMDEFAMGSSGEYSAFGPTKNPHDLERVPGGSSSGSAASLAANFVLGSFGSDTGGSIRQPAAFCGLVGLKPTYGTVSRYGLIAMASSLDQIGPLTKTVEDAELIFNIIQGKDKMDSTTTEIENRPQELGIKKFKIGLPKEYFTKGLDEEIKIKIDEIIKKLEKAGNRIEKISLPHTEFALPVYYIVMSSEVSSNLARYDGVRFPKLKIEDKKIKNIFDYYQKIRKEKFGSEVKKRIMLGTYALSSDYYQAYYLRAQKVRQLIKKDFEKAFEKIDLIISPTTPTPAFRINEKQDQIAMYLSDVFTVSVNLAGLPAVSLPVGKTRKTNLPIGLQIIAPWFQEKIIFDLGKVIENFN